MPTMVFKNTEPSQKPTDWNEIFPPIVRWIVLGVIVATGAYFALNSYLTRLPIGTQTQMLTLTDSLARAEANIDNFMATERSLRENEMRWRKVVVNRYRIPINDWTHWYDTYVDRMVARAEQVEIMKSRFHTLSEGAREFQQKEGRPPTSITMLVGYISGSSLGSSAANFDMRIVNGKAMFGGLLRYYEPVTNTVCCDSMIQLENGGFKFIYAQDHGDCFCR